MRVALAQLNPIVGDLAGNRVLIEEAARKAEAAGARLVVLPELALTGYPPMDLLERDGFVRDQLRELDRLAAASQGIDIVLGAVLPGERSGAEAPRRTARCCCAAARGARCRRRRCSRPTTSSTRTATSCPPRSGAWCRRSGGLPSLGLTVCEDAWTDVMGYELDPTGELAAQGAGLVRERVGVALPRREGRRATRDGVGAGAAPPACRCCSATRSAGTTSWSSTARPSRSTRTGRVRAALPHFEPALEVFELETGGEIVADPAPVAQLEARARARHPRLLPQAEPAARRGDRALGGRRLGADRAPRRRGARRERGGRARDAGPVLVAAQPRGRPRARRSGSASRCARSTSGRSTRPTSPPSARSSASARATGSPSRTSSRASAARC